MEIKLFQEAGIRKNRTSMDRKVRSKIMKVEERNYFFDTTVLLINFLVDLDIFSSCRCVTICDKGKPCYFTCL